MENDLISRQAAIAEFSCCELTPDGGIDANYAIDFLKQLPSAQPTIEPRKGKWIFNMKRGTMKIWTCSECGWNDIGEWNFCPNCGADMREENNG